MKNKFNEKLTDVLLASFILSIFYYIPFFGSMYWPQLFTNAFFVILAFFIFLKKPEFFFKKNGSLLILIFIFSVIYSLLIFNIQFVFLLSIIFAMAYSFLGYNVGLDNLRLGIFSRISSIILFLGLSWVVLAKFNGSLNYVYSIDYGVAVFDLNLYNNGYNIGRTGWNTSLIILFFLIFYLFSNADNNFDKTICFLNYILILSSIFVSDGKTGTLIIFFFLLYNFCRKIGYIKSSIFVLSFSLLIYYYFDIVKYFLIENSRVGLIFDNSADFTTGRGDAGLTALNLIQDNLILGTAYKGGYSLFDYGYDYKDIHNVWLNIIANYGIIFFVFYIITLLFFVFNAFKISWNKRNQYYLFYQLVLASFIVTLVEPWVFVSFIPYVAIFWFVLGGMSRSIK